MPPYNPLFHSNSHCVQRSWTDSVQETPLTSSLTHDYILHAFCTRNRVGARTTPIYFSPSKLLTEIESSRWSFYLFECIVYVIGCSSFVHLSLPVDSFLSILLPGDVSRLIRQVFVSLVRSLSIRETRSPNYA